MTDDADSGFLSRWSRRKLQARGSASGEALPEPVSTPPAEGASRAAPVASERPVEGAATRMPPAVAPASGPTSSEPAQAEPLPTLDDVARLTGESDFSRFVAPGIDERVKQAAMKKLFSDPHFNVMDGLDTYIDDYGKPDPLPAGMLRLLRQSEALGLFDNDDDVNDDDNDAAKAKAAAPPTEPEPTSPPAIQAPEPESLHDDHADLRLQPDHAPGRSGPGPSAGA